MEFKIPQVFVFFFFLTTQYVLSLAYLELYVYVMLYERF